jgi:monosaccharide-transporting ATPase
MDSPGSQAGVAAAPPLLAMEGIDKSFRGVPALTQARLTVRAGEVHALIGQNGAGKSTLIKILTGAYRRDAGGIVFARRAIDFRSPAEAQAAGLSTIYQELNLIPLRSVAENIFIGREPMRRGRIDWAAVHAEAERILSALGVALDVRQPLHRCSTAAQQMVAIARALNGEARLMIMDEPTSSLDKAEVEALLQVIRQLRAKGVAVIFVSHRLDELYAVCDRITVMRDGRTVAERDLAGFAKLALVQAMLGRELEALQGVRRDRAAAPTTALRATGLKSGVRVQDASLSIGEGEIVGLAGLLGAGRTEVARCVFGADPLERGEMALAGAPLHPRDPAGAIAAGIGFLSEDRKSEGIVPALSVQDNLTLVVLPGLTRWGRIDRPAARAIALRYIEQLAIRCTGPDQPIGELSGGNQQKVLLARWLAAASKLLLLDEPTRGIDVGAKAEILGLIRRLAEQGVSALLIASELEELVATSDRIVVMRDGRTVAELQGEALSEANIMAVMAGGSAAPTPDSDRAMTER